MATTESISTTYAGEAANRFFSAALLAPTTIANGGVTPFGGIKFKQVMPKLELSGIIADATCDFTDVGTITRTEKVLTLEDFEVNLKLCKSNYRPTFDAMGASRYAGLAPTFADHLMQLVGANIAANRETTIWQGDASVSGEFDGFETKLAADSDLPAANELAGTTVTASNVIAQLTAVLDGTPTRIYEKEGFGIRISTKIKKAFISAQAALGYLDRYHVDQTPLNFEGIPLIHCAGLSDDVMVATYNDNLFYGFGEAGDPQSARMIDQEPLDGSNNVHVVAKWGDGVEYAVVNDIITYGITNAAN